MWVIRFNMIAVRPVKKWIAMWSLLSRLTISCVPLRTAAGPYLTVWWQTSRGGGPVPSFWFFLLGHVVSAFRAARPRWSWPVKQISYKWTFPVCNTRSTPQWYNRHLNNSCWTYIDCLSVQLCSCCLSSGMWRRVVWSIVCPVVLPHFVKPQGATSQKTVKLISELCSCLSTGCIK